VQDLLFHLPLRYQDRTRVVPIGELNAGDQAVVQGVIERTYLQKGRRPMLVCRLQDGTGALALRFFHFRWQQQAQLKPGMLLRCFGEVRAGADSAEMIHPEYREVNEEDDFAVQDSLTPIYPASEGISQSLLRHLTSQALDLIAQTGVELRLIEWLPEEVLQPLALPSLHEALARVHRPPVDTEVALLEQGRHPAQQRLAFEELLAHHLSLRLLREQSRCLKAPPLTAGQPLIAQFVHGLPFTLTPSQQRVLQEILGDLGGEIPMQRLLQGDVGSGKTVVAACAVLAAVASGYQVALMAPTELLAEQHLHNLQRWLEPFRVRLVRLSGKVKGTVRQAVLESIASQHSDVIIGTHALFQRGVSFARLGLVIIDEQHRFGVHQRYALREKGRQEDRFPHQLIMTATPIPRTLAMVAYADLDCSAITELPPGRMPVQTVVVPDTRRPEVIERVHSACRAGRQAYWVCTLVEESELLQAEAAADTATRLAESLPELRIGLIHGRMKSQDKEQVMAAFRARELDLLVATTVIEVGVDVPAASLMIIENAERLGLAQLHQLRGRVGRGSAHSHCILMYHSPLSEQARERLAVLRAVQDGFEIARRDLELRGPGELLGTQQAGMLQLHIADLLRDRVLIPCVEQAADLLLKRYPERVQPLVRRWAVDRVDYGSI
jgi:ATP-dependent DNA helicase RecG